MEDHAKSKHLTKKGTGEPIQERTKGALTSTLMYTVSQPLRTLKVQHKASHLRKQCNTMGTSISTAPPQQQTPQQQTPKIHIRPQHTRRPASYLKHNGQCYAVMPFYQKTRDAEQNLYIYTDFMYWLLFGYWGI